MGLDDSVRLLRPLEAEQLRRAKPEVKRDRGARLHAETGIALPGDRVGQIVADDQIAAVRGPPVAAGEPHAELTGAAEPDGRGLDHAWFQGDAALATPGDPWHAIYAVSYKPTGVRFPMVWAEGEAAHAVDVTDALGEAHFSLMPP